ncbi:MAG: hypothetical protein QOD06_720, partial [Candidatus Binatota bacterium]|nr:hypothetical protein [Candidatus Binatota bacterium]
VPLDREVREELLDLLRAHLRWMTLPLIDDESADPRDVRLLGPGAPVPRPERVSHDIEKPRSAIGSRRFCDEDRRIGTSRGDREITGRMSRPTEKHESMIRPPVSGGQAKRASTHALA